MKLLLILLLASVSASAQDPPSKYDTVKCWTVGIEWNKDSTAHLIMVKSWMVREYAFAGYGFALDTTRNYPGSLRGLKHTPIWHTMGIGVKYLSKNKGDIITPASDFKPIIQDWK